MLICQSCSLPLSAANFRGTNADGSSSTKFCRLCFEKGEFLEPEISKNAMLDKVITLICAKSEVNEASIRQVLEQVFTKLERWQ